jgi:hypothetical protein
MQLRCCCSALACASLHRDHLWKRLGCASGKLRNGAFKMGEAILNRFGTILSGESHNHPGQGFSCGYERFTNVETTVDQVLNRYNAHEVYLGFGPKSRLRRSSFQAQIMGRIPDSKLLFNELTSVSLPGIRDRKKIFKNSRIYELREWIEKVQGAPKRGAGHPDPTLTLPHDHPYCNCSWIGNPYRMGIT